MAIHMFEHELVIYTYLIFRSNVNIVMKNLRED